MLDFLFKSPIWQVLAISDWISKYVIILGLMLLSIACVAIIILKYTTFKFQRKQMQLLLLRVKKAKTINDITEHAETFKHSSGGLFLKQSTHKLAFMLESKKRSTESSPSLSFQDIEHLELLLSQDIDNLLMEEEALLPVLGTSAAVAPLVGLFGTIWGLIHSFISISQEKSADIAAVAPGIAAALLTTLAGLVVAIPAMIAFHYFSNQLRKREAQFGDLSDMFLILTKQSFIK